jgi:glycosyltransferase involved in cell wall biosynthesis
MRIAFYAPMKPPDHPVPSGDRRVARLLMEALKRNSHDVVVPSRLRTWQAEPNADAQRALEDRALAEAANLIEAYGRDPNSTPKLWFSYHVYYKAPDWIGPRVASALAIPYVTAEASVAYKRAGGPWDLGHRAVLTALNRAAAVVTFNPVDAACLPDPGKVRRLKPFLDVRPYRAARGRREATRKELARMHALDPERIWLLSVAMMRPGDKLRSYRLLAEALTAISDRPWHLLVVGDGEVAAETREAFENLPSDRVHFLGALDEDALPAHYAAADLFVWPAINEAFGMAILEAQATGLPVLAGEGIGVAEVVEAGKTGVLVPHGSSRRFAEELARLMEDRRHLERFSVRALEITGERHGLETAADYLKKIIEEVAAREPRRS